MNFPKVLLTFLLFPLFAGLAGSCTIPDDYEPDLRNWIDGRILFGVYAPDVQNGIVGAEVSSLGTFTLVARDQSLLRPKGIVETDIRLSGGVSPSSVPSGANATYTFTISNVGSNPGESVILVQDLPAAAALVSATSSAGFCHIGDGKPLSAEIQLHENPQTRAVYCKVGDLLPGATVTAEIVIKTVVFGDGIRTTPVSMASDIRVSSAHSDSNPDNNQITVTFSAVPSSNRPPVVRIIQPDTDAVFVGSNESPAMIPMEITATDPDGNVAEVKVYESGEFVGDAISVGGGVFTFNFITARTGYHSLTALAKDNENRHNFSAAVQVLVNSPNTIIITKPSKQLFSPGSPVEIETRSSVAGNRLQKVEIFDNGILLGELRAVSNTGNLYTHRLTVPALQRGRHSLTAQLTDLSGAMTISQSFSFKVTDLPAIAITAPTDATAFASGSSIDITVHASDADGWVKELNFYANGKLIGTKSESIVKGNSTFTWIGPPDGEYLIVATATDDTDETVTSNPFTIRVNRLSPAVGELNWINDRLQIGATSAHAKQSEIAQADALIPITSTIGFKKVTSDCSVDFKNFSYPSAFSPRERFSLVAGKLQPTRYPDGRVDKMGYFLIGEDYGDIAGDQNKEAIITLGAITGGSAAPSIVYVFDILDEEARLLWTAGDRAYGGLRNIFASEGDLIIEEYEPSETSGACCPTSYTSSRYRWVSDRFLPTERRVNIPNPTASAGFVGKNVLCQ